MSTISGFVIAGGIACLLCALLTPLCKRVATALSLTDNPRNDALKIHGRPVPFLGGMAVLAALLAALGVSLLFLPVFSIPRPTTEVLKALLSILALSWIAGLWDDLRWQVRTIESLIIKILSQGILVLAVVVLLSWADIGFFLTMNEHVNMLISGALFLVVLNAANIQDGLDGLLATLTSISSLGFALLFAVHPHNLGLLLSLLLLGAVVGFLLFNAPPASIFLGDNGSYVIGATLSILALLAMTQESLRGVVAPLLMIGMPLLNMIFIVLRRVAHKRSPLLGDRDHLYDSIYRTTKSTPVTVLINAGVHTLLVAGGLALILI